jgi:hypothetical protein
MELQSVIAFACYDSPSIIGAGVSMTEAAMEQFMTKLCFGNGNDEETICYVDRFLYGLNRFQDLAKKVFCNCKKLQAIVTANNSPYKDGDSGPSGTNWEDYIQWCLKAMYKAESANEVGIKPMQQTMLFI